MILLGRVSYRTDCSPVGTIYHAKTPRAHRRAACGPAIRLLKLETAFAQICKRVIAGRFGVDYHERYVGKLLKKLGFSHMSARPRHPAQNERIVEAFKNVWPPPSARGLSRLLSDQSASTYPASRSCLRPRKLPRQSNQCLAPHPTPHHGPWGRPRQERPQRGRTERIRRGRSSAATTQKNDDRDAEGIAEAATRPTMGSEGGMGMDIVQAIRGSRS